MENGLGLGNNGGLDLGLTEGNETNFVRGFAKGIYNENPLNPQIVKRGLLIHYDAGNLMSYPGNGIIWRDLSGNGNNATLLNGPRFSNEKGGCIVFDGVDDAARLLEKIYIFNGITIDFWLYPTRLLNAEMLMDFGRSGNPLYVYSSGSTRLSVQIFTTGSASNLGYYETNKWQNYVFTADGTRHIFYKNGVQDFVNTASDVPASVLRLPNFCSWNTSFFQEAWQGRIAIIRIYSVALSASEQLQNFNVTRYRFGI